MFVKERGKERNQPKHHCISNKTDLSLILIYYLQPNTKTWVDHIPFLPHSLH